MTPAEKKPRKKPKHYESQMQITLMEWARLRARSVPELDLLYANPNGGKRLGNPAILTAEGVKAGIPDLHLPILRGVHIGLWIEMKYGKNKPTAEQRWWISRLRKEGHRVAVCYDWTEARDCILAYLDRKHHEAMDYAV